VAVASLGAASQTPTVRAFVGARLVDGDGRVLAPKGVIVVRDGRIAAIGAEGSTAVPAGAERIDVAGSTIMPGLVNAHGHVGDTNGLQAARSSTRRPIFSSSYGCTGATA